jgi:hypothetical protein
VFVLVNEPAVLVTTAITTYSNSKRVNWYNARLLKEIGSSFRLALWVTLLVISINVACIALFFQKYFWFFGSLVPIKYAQMAYAFRLIIDVGMVNKVPDL